ncbi:MAG TPA: WecB/TagA/CpsF family glycosyltransferase, partial [Acidobacteriaceae bacterium]|nr:WecB/TagA/CpsF family glycosyltransferase [Acidobacteriaceae bacterium]
MNLPIRRIDTPPETSVLGVRTHAANVESAKAVFLSALKRHAKGYVCFSCVHGVMEAQRDRELKRIYDGALLVAPDGMPLAWVGKLQGFRTMERVAGPEMMLELMASEDFRKYSHFLCGGEPGMAEDLRDRLTQRFPGVNICGVFTPPFRAMRADEERELIETVHRVQPDIVWVGLGAPK